MRYYLSYEIRYRRRLTKRFPTGSPLDRRRRSGAYHQTRTPFRRPGTISRPTDSRAVAEPPKPVDPTNSRTNQRSHRGAERRPVTTYFDTGVLVKIYAEEFHSDLAISLIEKAQLPLPFTHFHSIELSNAIQLKRFRKELTSSEERASLRLIDADQRAGRLYRPPYDLAAIFTHAEQLSIAHTSRIGARSLDILHVAAAINLGCSAFCSFDKRQRAMATRAKLVLQPRALPH